METLFSFENVENIIKELKEKLNFPFVSAYASTLGGKENVSVMFTISLDPKENWINGILQNSTYGNFSLNREGTIENFSGYGFRFRKRKVKSISNLIEKLNQIKKGA